MDYLQNLHMTYKIDATVSNYGQLKLCTTCYYTSTPQVSRLHDTVALVPVNASC